MRGFKMHSIEGKAIMVGDGGDAVLMGELGGGYMGSDLMSDGRGSII